MVDNLSGRTIEDVPYSGLIESLSKITLICHTAGEARNDLTKDDLMNFISQIAVIGTEAMVFAGVTREEINQVTQYLLSGMSVGQERNN
ncbi:hypothetical protein [Mesorhizobium sp. KR1-2]|uniref:hypothetical protein n=1 Tax=Mesorhizobium sp. KR1-2 TaxID=3156609 RepID=UPI0032B40636